MCLKPPNFNTLAYSFKVFYGSNISDHHFEMYGLEIIVRANEEAPKRQNSGPIQGMLRTSDGVVGTLRMKLHDKAPGGDQQGPG